MQKIIHLAVTLYVIAPEGADNVGLYVVTDEVAPIVIFVGYGEVEVQVADVDGLKGGQNAQLFGQMLEQIRENY